MSTMLNLVDRLLAQGRKMRQFGRDHDAHDILTAVSGFRELPSEVAEMTQVLLAEIEIQRRQYRRARRHLTAALRHRPDNARYHYLMAIALESDKKGDAERASAHFARSLELDPEQPACLSASGMLCVKLGRTAEGIGLLRQAVEKAPSDPVAVKKLSEGLRLAERTDEARAVLLAARFRNPRDGRFRKLWDDFQFHELRLEQESARRDRVHAAAESEGPTLLPFVRVARPTRTRQLKGKIIRRDAPAPTSAPHTPEPNRLPGKRQAQ